jgi:hypothetical protein
MPKIGEFYHLNFHTTQSSVPSMNDYKFKMNFKSKISHAEGVPKF